MKLRKLIKVNIINISILALVFLFHFVAGLLFNDHDGADSSFLVMTNIMSIILFVGWAGYTIYSNMSVIKEEQTMERKSLAEIRSRIQKAGNLKFFTRERNHLLNLWDSVQGREKYFMSDERDHRVRELYELTRNQMMRNVTDACEYMESFDYISGRDSGYLSGLCNESQVLLDKFNKMVELSVSVDDSVLSYDTREIDDMIDTLEMMKKTGRKTLGT